MSKLVPQCKQDHHFRVFGTALWDVRYTILTCWNMQLLRTVLQRNDKDWCTWCSLKKRKPSEHFAQNIVHDGRESTITQRWISRHVRHHIDSAFTPRRVFWNSIGIWFEKNCLIKDRPAFPLSSREMKQRKIGKAKREPSAKAIDLQNFEHRVGLKL